MQGLVAADQDKQHFQWADESAGSWRQLFGIPFPAGGGWLEFRLHATAAPDEDCSPSCYFIRFKRFQFYIGSVKLEFLTTD